MNIQKGELVMEIKAKEWLDNKVKVGTVIVSVIIIMVFSTTAISKHQYKQDLLEISDLMEDSMIDAELMVDEYATVWEDTIDSGDFGNEVNGEIVYDFNDAILNQYVYFTENGQIDEMRKNQDKVKDRMKDLKNPPAKYEKAYDHMVNMYASFKLYTGLGMEPDGSLQSYNEKSQEAYDDFEGELDKVEAVIE